MLPHDWIPHRREDGEAVGWIALDGDDVAAFDLLGRRVTAPGVDWLEAEQELEARGLGYLAGEFTLLRADEPPLPVRIGEVRIDHVSVVVDEFGGASVVGADPETHVLPFPVPPGALHEYVRPRLDLETYLDVDGRPIPYGSVYWGEVEPPPEVYSTCAHPERFRPVIDVALALADHLERTYEIVRDETTAKGRTDVTLTPSAGAGSPISFVLGPPERPAVTLRAGHRFRALWPDCGCDACDDAVPGLLDDLEATVLAITAGLLSEWRSRSSADGSWSTHTTIEGVTEESAPGVSEGESNGLPTTPHRWEPWPLRARRGA